MGLIWGQPERGEASHFRRMKRPSFSTQTVPTETIHIIFLAEAKLVCQVDISSQSQNGHSFFTFDWKSEICILV